MKLVAKNPTTDLPPQRGRAAVRGTMRAARITAPGKIDIVSVPMPRPGPHEILVRLAGCGVCASNIPVWEGKPWFSYPLAPGAPGHEPWGTVEQTGESVSEFRPGDRVAFLSSNGFAEFDIADAGSAVKLPAKLNQEPFPGEPLSCAMNIFRRSEIKKDDMVLIIGVGFLGALLTQLTSTIAARVIAISRRPFALQIAREMGATECVAIKDHSHVIAQVKKLTGDRFCDVVIECTGKQEPLNLAAELARERGRLVIAGYHQDGPRQINMQLWNWRGLDVINAHERDPRVYVDGMKQAIRAVESGLLKPGRLYTHLYPLEQLEEALNSTTSHPDGFMKAMIQL
jgi:threonine dehydrogenase-like Zn-dependent dehydrogenase